VFLFVVRNMSIHEVGFVGRGGHTRRMTVMKIRDRIETVPLRIETSPFIAQISFKNSPPSFSHLVPQGKRRFNFGTPVEELPFLAERLLHIFFLLLSRYLLPHPLETFRIPLTQLGQTRRKTVRKEHLLKSCQDS
jgi:hypothetical protein